MPAKVCRSSTVFGQVAQLLPALRFSLDVLRIDLPLRHGRLGETDGDLEVGRVDDHQQVAFMHKLVVGDGQLDDIAGDLGSHRYDVDAHRAVARPRCPHIGVPHSPAERAGDRERDQSYQERKDSETTPRRLAVSRLGCPDGCGSIRCRFAL